MYSRRDSSERRPDGMGTTTAGDASLIQLLGNHQAQNVDWLAARDDRPWNHQRLMPDITSSYASRENFMGYRSTGVVSECETVPGDSGYGSYVPPGFDNNSTASFYADDTFDQPTALDPAVENINFEMTAFDMNYGSHSEQPALGALPTHGNLWCPTCDTNVKTKSELKKHELRHTKPFKCHFPECVKKNRGFASQNDLARHDSCVHGNVARCKTYTCPYPPCTTKDKQRWPRADNFRSHLRRIHKMKVSADDIDISRYLSPPEEPISQVPSEGEILRGVEALSGVGTQYQDSTNGILSQSAATLDLNADFPEVQTPMRPQHVSEAEAQLAMYNPELEDLMISPAIYEMPSCEPQPPSMESFQEFPFAISKPQAELRADTLDPKAEEVQASGLQDTLSEDVLKPQVSDDGNSSHENSDSESTSSGDQGSIADNLRAMLTKGSKEELLECLSHIPKEILETAYRESASGAYLKSEEDARRYCEVCKKTFNRPCELRKHARRHERPYACTLAKCDKRFGSKNDWKRHEVGQHKQGEVWSCDQPGCGYFAQQREDLQAHLCTLHKITEDEAVEIKLENNRRGCHCLSDFWCGFCKKNILIKVDEKSKPYVDQRFDHIDEHFMGRGEYKKASIESWEHPEAHFDGMRDPLHTKKRKSQQASASADPRPKKRAHTAAK